jgi:hypothetical protein
MSFSIKIMDPYHVEPFSFVNSASSCWYMCGGMPNPTAGRIIDIQLNNEHELLCLSTSFSVDVGDLSFKRSKRADV